MTFLRGMTLVELVIVMAIVAILMMMAVPGYRSFMLPVYRGEAIRMLLQASMCQQRVHARDGSYDTNLCQSSGTAQHYRISYTPIAANVQAYTAIATPLGTQLNDLCGNLSLDQSGLRAISGKSVSAAKCWNGR